MMRLQGKTIGYFIAQELEDLEFWVPVTRLREENVEDISNFCRELVAALAE